MNEHELPDDYPVHYGYLYVADNRVIQSNITGIILDLKRIGNYSVITNCDIDARDLWDYLSW